jgi:glycosyltransferase involved in cell wall biosynthesis
MHCDWLLQFDRRLIAPRIALADVIIGVSDYVTNGIRRAFPEFEDRCVTVFNGTDVHEITPRGEPPDGDSQSVVFVGRVSPEKGVHVLINAFEQVANHCPNAHLEIIGPEHMAPQGFIVTLSGDPTIGRLSRFYDGRSYSKRLYEQVRERLEGRVILLGYLPRDQLIKHLRQANLFVQPSIASEMFGMAVADAMAAALPVVATNVCGLPELVANGETGLLVPPDNADELAEAILHLLNDPSLSERMGRAGRSRVERRFSWEAAVDRLNPLYQAVVAGEPIASVSTAAA